MVKKIIKWPNQALRGKCGDVDFRADWFHRDLVRGHIMEMQQTLAVHPGGLALAYNQIDTLGWAWSAFVHKGQEGFLLPQVVFNPKWKPVEEAGQSFEEEGCLSIPELRIPVPRWNKVDIDFNYEDGEPGHFEVEGLEARMVQHECDHLDGKLLVDFLPKDAQVKLRMQVIKNRKAGR